MTWLVVCSKGHGHAALSFPSYSSASWSIRGAIIRQGPHQGAQKSTRTGMSLLRTSSSNVASVASLAEPARPKAWRVFSDLTFPLVSPEINHERAYVARSLYLSRQKHPRVGKRALSTRANTSLPQARACRESLYDACGVRPTRVDPFLRLHHQTATPCGSPRQRSSGANLSPVEALGSEGGSLLGAEAGGGSDGRHSAGSRLTKSREGYDWLSALRGTGRGFRAVAMDVLRRGRSFTRCVRWALGQKTQRAGFRSSGFSSRLNR